MPRNACRQDEHQASPNPVGNDRQDFGIAIRCHSSNGYPATGVTADALTVLLAVDFFDVLEDFLEGPFLAAFSCSAFSALTLAHRAFVAAMIRARPALLIRRFRCEGCGAGACSDPLFIFCHLAFCASAIFRLEAAENFFRLSGPASLSAVGSGRSPSSIPRSSAIWTSICFFWVSKPSIAA